MTRKTANDYRLELHSLKLQELKLKARINNRFQTLCKQCPEVMLYQVGNVNVQTPVLAGWFCEDNPIRVATLDVNAKLNYIETIEKHLLAKKSAKL
jgi:hypothetical protein